jgi:predicted RNA-binding Zn-ribbon protein involved in translation (DUF1610 family)
MDIHNISIERTAEECEECAGKLAMARKGEIFKCNNCGHLYTGSYCSCQH